MNLDLQSCCEALGAATPALEAGQFAVHELDAWPGHFVGRSADGSPSVLLTSRDHGVRAPLKLAGLEVNYSVPCRLIFRDGNSADELLTTVRCSTADLGVQKYFINLMEAVVKSVGVRPALAQISEAILSLVEILQQLNEPARKSAAGCFGELLIIKQSADISTALSAWRNAVDDRFDFAIGDARLEVKSSGNRTRIHHFSTEQCSLTNGEVGILVSMFVESCSGGTTIQQLVRRIEEQISCHQSLILKLRRSIADTLGKEAPAALNTEFDERLATNSQLFFSLSSIPAIRTPLPAGVDNVRFRSDISHTLAAPRAVLVAECPLLDTLLPP